MGDRGALGASLEAGIAVRERARDRTFHDYLDRRLQAIRAAQDTINRLGSVPGWGPQNIAEARRRIEQTTGDLAVLHAAAARDSRVMVMRGDASFDQVISNHRGRIAPKPYEINSATTAADLAAQTQASWRQSRAPAP